MATSEQAAILKQGVDAWNQWRTEDQDVVHPDLAGIDLKGVDLSLANLSGTDLRQADLRDAKLHRTILRGASLEGANFGEMYVSDVDLHAAKLDRANLSGTRFIHVDLLGASLINANLSSASFQRCSLLEADLSGAFARGADLFNVSFGSTNLTDADFTDTSFSWCIFADVDLRKVIGLDSARHDGPSTIGIDTLIKSTGRIPESFLRGTGLPEQFIVYARSLTDHAIGFYSCFISHSHADKPFARRLHDALQSRGIRCWLDEKHLLPGDDIYEHVDRGIRMWDKLLLCCTEKSLTSWWVEDEIGKAFAKEQRIMNERGRKVLVLIPLDLDGYLFGGWKSGKASQVRERFAADFRGWEASNAKCEEGIEKVIRGLRYGESAREMPPEPKL